MAEVAVALAHPDLRFICRVALTRHGHTVTEISHSDDARRILEPGPQDVALVDPELLGHDPTRVGEQLLHAATPTVVFIWRRYDTLHRRLSRAAPAHVRLLRVPFGIAAMIDAVAELSDR